MPKSKAKKVKMNGKRETFPTLDDAVEKVHDAKGKMEEAAIILNKVSAMKRPFDIRRGRILRKEVEETMSDERESKILKVAGRTYFLDVEKTKQDKPYLRITESKKGEDGKFGRNSVLVFPEDAAEFGDAVALMLDKLAA